MCAETAVQPFRSMEEATSEQVRRYITEGGEHLSKVHIPTLLHLFDLGKGAHFGGFPAIADSPGTSSSGGPTGWPRPC